MMPKRYLIDIDSLSNGGGKAVYGGRLDAYAFSAISVESWFGHFAEEIISAIGKNYYPVYRMADGELHFLFGPRINWKTTPVLNVLRFLKYGVLGISRKTSWNEAYPAKKRVELRQLLQKYILKIASHGKLAVYWNENGLHAFTEYNRVTERSFANIGVNLNDDNYVPFHFCQALVAKYTRPLLFQRSILVVSGISEPEFYDLQEALLNYGATRVELLRCSRSSALLEDYSIASLKMQPDLVLVAAGIGAAKVLVDLEGLNCPVLDIGSYIHVLSGSVNECHAGFFVNPLKS